MVEDDEEAAEALLLIASRSVGNNKAEEKKRILVDNFEGKKCLMCSREVKNELVFVKLMGTYQCNFSYDEGDGFFNVL